MKILIMAGGTGGHIFPALAVAKKMLEKNHVVLWLGSLQGMEAEIVPQYNIAIEYISISGLRGKGWKTWLLAPFKLCLALWQSVKVVKRFNPDVVLGMGGFVTGPAGLATRLLRKPLVIHEQNAIAGVTNQILAKFSQKVLAAFPNSFPNYPKALLIGNPVRENFYQFESPEIRFKNRNPQAPLRLLILGGSRGAKQLNTIVAQVITEWPNTKALEVVHQTGKSDFERIQKIYKSHYELLCENSTTISPAKASAFIKDMAAAYAWADLVICRAGALTVAELAATGVGSILIPFPYAVDDHQTKNAGYLAAGNAAKIIPEKDLTTANLTQEIQTIFSNRDIAAAMACAAYKLAQPQALEKVVQQCLAV